MPDDPILDFGEPRVPPGESETARKPQVVTDGARDESLAAEVRQRLEKHQMVDASRVTVQVVNGGVFLSGTAENRFIRERAEDLAREVEGVVDVVNKISVQPPTEQAGPILSTHEPGANNTGSTRRS